MSVLTIAGSPAPGDTGRGAGTPSVVLTVPGLHGSGPEHWQSHWERARPALRRVEQPDWEVPDIDRWAASIAAHLAPGGPPAILVAHSFGCLAAVRFAWQHPGRVRAALLVAPANPGRFDATEALPLQALPFPAILVASRNDPWLSFPKALFWATMWRTQLFDLGYAGHINAESGYGPWPEGLGLLNRVSQLRPPARRAA